MKRELAFALEAQSQLTEPLGRTRSSKPDYSSSEKIPNFPENESESNGSIDRPTKNSGEISMCNVLYVYRRNKRFKTSRPEIESVTAEEPIGGFATPICVEEKNSKFVAAEIEEKSTAAVVRNGFPVEIPRRFTRSALKSNVEGSELAAVNSVVSEGVKDDEAVLEGEGNKIGAFGTPKKKMELKMSKKIALKKKPITVKELFETGLLEGYPVFYKGWKKGNAVRGEIKDFGILCSCNLCNGSRIVSPSEFEVHACKSHRRALRYICLENGKSLLQVLKACKKSSLETLEETIQNVIGPLPVKESIICQNCKVSFLPTCTAKQSCDSCLDSMKSQARPTDTNIDSLKSQASPTNTAVVRDGPSKPVMVMKSSTSGKVSMSSRKRSHGKMKRKSSEPALATTSPRRAPVHNLSREKSQWKITKSSRSALVPKSPKSASVRMPQNKSEGKISKKLSKSVPLPRSRKSYSKSKWKITKKDQRMHKLVFEEGGLPDGTEVAYYSRGMKLLEGYKKGSGIFCRCCNSEVSASQFEAHAGWASRRKPYGYIYTSNGVSLHELAISLLKDRKYSTKDNDDLCIICADGGNLLLCDGCPRAFHKECAMLSSIPRGKWYCTYCNNMFQREKFVERNANALAAGRVSGVDLIEQITTRCIRIVKTPEDAEVIACVLCRGYDFSKSGFGSRTVILCDQCEKEYHIGCLKKHNMADLEELPKEKWFCCMDCRRIYSALQNLLICGAEKLPDSLLDTIRKKEKDKGLDSVTNIDVSWRVLSGKLASRETRLLLSEAVAIFHDCFDPIVDSVTGCDFIPTMVYGRNIRGQDFGGMYCAILTVNSSVVSAGILRVFGRDMAELPLVATSNGKQGKGYFQLLFSCIEKLLAFLKVKTLVLPAAEVAESIWTDKFCFKRIAPEQFINYKKDFWQMLTFKGTSMLEKEVPQCRVTRRDTTAFDISMEL